MRDSGEVIGQDGLYTEAAAEYGGAIDRLARAYEAEAELRRDLSQEIHLELWRSFAVFDGRCSMRTWVYRVAHNTATSHVMKRRRDRRTHGAGVEALADVASADDPENAVAERRALEGLMALVQQFGPLDRQVALLYLEDLDAAAIGEVTGLSPGAVSQKVHRLKALLARRFRGDAT